MSEPLGLAVRVHDAVARSPVAGTVRLAALLRDDARDASDDCVLLGADEPVTAASTIKVPILAAALGEVASTRLGLDDRITVPLERAGGSGVLQATPGIRELTLADLLTLMIVVSDNTATNVVIDLIGMARINAYCRAAGLAATVVRRVMMDADARARGVENTTSALDQANLLAGLAWGELLTAELRAFAIRTLRRQQFNDGLPALLPDDVVLAHKTGELPGVRHDVGIVDGTDGRRAVVAVLVTDLTGPCAAHAATGLIGAVGEAAWKAVSGGAAADRAPQAAFGEE